MFKGRQVEMSMQYLIEPVQAYAYVSIESMILFIMITIL